MKELNEYKAEIYRRSDERAANKKIMHRKTATLCIVLALCIALGTFAAFRFTGNTNEAPVLPPETTYLPASSGGSQTVGTTAAPRSTETEKTPDDMIKVPYGNKSSADLMEGISSKRISKGVDKSSVSAKLTDFAVRLFKQTNEKGKSTLVSPLSAMMALAMTANGANGETLAQMEKVLGMDIDTLNEVLSMYRESLPQDEKYKFDIANAIWFKTDPFFSVNKDFLQKNADWYDAGLYAAPFDNTTLDEINSWVKTNTRGMIDKILDKISDDAVMYLVNALAFQAEWEVEYGKDDVCLRTFTLENKTKKDTTFMFSKENAYIKDENAEGFIKYYKDKKYAFVALLPDDGVSLSDYIDSLTGEKVCKLLNSAETATVYASMPKFKSGSQIKMGDALKAMEMPLAFDKKLADFSDLGTYKDGNLYIGGVAQKTFIEVSEKGTKAAAATAVEIVTVTGVLDHKEVNLDRPFVYMLIDCETNTPFFIGTLTDVE